jgi:hypothetical protein
MNRAIELHDSNLAGVESVGADAVFHLDAAYVHGSEGRPGIDPGFGWLQAVDLVVSGAVIESLPQGLPAALVDGVLTAGGTALENLIPLPLMVEGTVLLAMTTSDGERVLVHGSGPRFLPRGEPRFLEPFPGQVEG